MTQILQILLVMLLWASCFPIIAYGLSYAPHITFAALRAFIAGVVLLIPALILRRPQPKEIRMWLKISVIGLGATTLGFFGMFHASEFISPGIATVITNTQPLIAAIFASIFLKERVDTAGKTGFLLGFLGIVLITFPNIILGSDNKFILGVLYITLSAIGITISNILIRYSAHSIDALSAMGWQLIIGSFFLIVIALFTEDISNITWNMSFTLSLLGLAIPGTALSYWLWFRILKETELNHANSFSFLIPIFGVTMGIFFFNEKINTLTLSGIGLTVFGIVLVNWPHSSELVSCSKGKHQP